MPRVRNYRDFIFPSLAAEGPGLEEWLSLYAPVCAHWVPTEWDQADPHATVRHIYDDRRLPETRVRRLKPAMFHAQKPPSRTIHVYTNFRAGPMPGSVVCSHEVAEFRNRKHCRHVGLARYRVDAARLIIQKRFDPIDCDAVQDGISIIL